MRALNPLSGTLRTGVRRLLKLLSPRGKAGRSSETTYVERVRLLESNYHKKILYGSDGNALIGDRIASRQPLMVARLGAAELACIAAHSRDRAQQRAREYPAEIGLHMFRNAGFFPNDARSLDRFSETFLAHVPDTDIMAVWFNEFEDVVCNRLCPQASLVELGCLEPFHFERPWSAALVGRKVLVVHPFAASIERQYVDHREHLFANPRVLPTFELRTIKAVQSIAGSPVGFKTWFEAYDHMCAQIAEADFDVAIIGAGAYGLPLASFVKRMGKQAVHMGGVTQILFGIKGKRWETEYADTIGKLFNEHWVRPTESETPARHTSVEDGCYW